jgi:hypothetical protein
VPSSGSICREPAAGAGSSTPSRGVGGNHSAPSRQRVLHSRATMFRRLTRTGDPKQPDHGRGLHPYPMWGRVGVGRDVHDRHSEGLTFYVVEPLHLARGQCSPRLSVRERLRTGMPGCGALAQPCRRGVLAAPRHPHRLTTTSTHRLTQPHRSSRGQPPLSRFTMPCPSRVNMCQASGSSPRSLGCPVDPLTLRRLSRAAAGTGSGSRAPLPLSCPI